MEDGGDERRTLSVLLLTRTRHVLIRAPPTTCAGIDSSSHHAPKLINRAKDAPHPDGAQSRSHPCTSSYQGRRCSCTSARRNACARGVGGGTRGGRRYNREEGGNTAPA
jgi:hypothetical protein